jgi:hypothetical protein
MGVRAGMKQLMSLLQQINDVDRTAGGVFSNLNTKPGMLFSFLQLIENCREQRI